MGDVGKACSLVAAWVEVWLRWYLRLRQSTWKQVTAGKGSSGGMDKRNETRKQETDILTAQILRVGPHFGDDAFDTRHDVCGMDGQQ